MKAHSVKRAHYVENIVDGEMSGIDYGDTYPYFLQVLMNYAKGCKEEEVEEYIAQIKNYCAKLSIAYKEEL